MHDAGIAIYASFMFGFDHDEPDVFERTSHFAMQTGLIWRSSPVSRRVKVQSSMRNLKGWPYSRGGPFAEERTECYFQAKGDDD